MTPTRPEAGKNMNDDLKERGAFKEFRAALARFNDANTPVSIADRVMILSNATFLLNEYVRAASPQAEPEGTYPPCQGMNCGCTDGANHSPECFAEHAATIAGGQFIKGFAAQPVEQAAATQTEAGMSEGRALTEIRQAIADYHFALDTRAHGGVAQDRAFNAICKALEMHWKQGDELTRRALAAALPATGGKP